MKLKLYDKDRSLLQHIVAGMCMAIWCSIVILLSSIMILMTWAVFSCISISDLAILGKAIIGIALIISGVFISMWLWMWSTNQ